VRQEPDEAGELTKIAENRTNDCANSISRAVFRLSAGSYTPLNANGRKEMVHTRGLNNLELAFG
jgi:hypothetical protein